MKINLHFRNLAQFFLELQMFHTEIVEKIKSRILWFLVNDQLEHNSFSMYLFRFSTGFEQPRAHHQENQLYQYNLWYMSHRVGDRFVCMSERKFPTTTKRSQTQWHKPDVVLIQFILLMMSTGFSKHVKNWNKYTGKELCVKMIIYQELRVV
jgi:hypothetical protein